VIIGNRDRCQSLAKKHDLEFHNIGDERGNPDNKEMVRLFDSYDVDYGAARSLYARPASSNLLEAESSICTMGCCLLIPGFNPMKMLSAIIC
jgi:formyltetrahydrofolate deformylase